MSDLGLRFFVLRVNVAILHCSFSPFPYNPYSVRSALPGYYRVSNAYLKPWSALRG